MRDIRVAEREAQMASEAYKVAALANNDDAARVAAAILVARRQRVIRLKKDANNELFNINLVTLCLCLCCTLPCCWLDVEAEERNLLTGIARKHIPRGIALVAH
jgi:hypothetical protein